MPKVVVLIFFFCCFFSYSHKEDWHLSNWKTVGKAFGHHVAPLSTFGPMPKAIAPWLQDTTTYRGDGTAFSNAVNNTGAGFACSYRYLNDRFSSFFAAINQEQWEMGAACGRCVKARCVDPRCEIQNQDIIVQIVDLCPECKMGDVDFSYPAYEALTGLWPHRLTIEWEWVSCAPDIDGTIVYYPKQGSNPYWQAFYLSNYRFPIQKAYLNGVELERSQYQFFIHADLAPQCPCELVLEADSGSILNATIEDLFSQQDLGVQFSLWPFTLSTM